MVKLVNYFQGNRVELEKRWTSEPAPGATNFLWKRVASQPKSAPMRAPCSQLPVPQRAAVSICSAGSETTFSLESPLTAGWRRDRLSRSCSNSVSCRMWTRADKPDSERKRCASSSWRNCSVCPDRHGVSLQKRETFGYTLAPAPLCNPVVWMVSNAAGGRSHPAQVEVPLWHLQQIQHKTIVLSNCAWRITAIEIKLSCFSGNNMHNWCVHISEFNK